MEIRFYGEHDRGYVAEVTPHYSTAYLYGSDADGNRGVMTRDIEGYSIDFVYDEESGNEWEVTDVMKPLIEEAFWKEVG